MKHSTWIIGGGLTVFVAALLFVVPVYAFTPTPPPPSLLNAKCESRIDIDQKVYAGEKFTATVSIKNTGASTWNSGQGFFLGSQKPQDNLTWGLSRVPLPTNVVPPAVKPDKNAKFTISATAPARPGTYPFAWRMLQEGKTWFGDICSLNLTVTGRPNQKVTPTPTPTQTPTSTITTALKCFPDAYLGSVYNTGDGYPIGQEEILNATLTRVDTGNPIPNASIQWSMREGSNGLTQQSSVTDNNGIAANLFTMPQIPGLYVVRAEYDPGIIGPNGTHLGTSSCDMYFNSSNTPDPYNPYDGQSPTPYVSALSVNITSPAENASFAQGTQIPIAVSGDGTPTCGTWTLTKPNGETVTLTAADFVELQLPGGIPSCTSAYDTY